jgi:hypothetical protein
MGKAPDQRFDARSGFKLHGPDTQIERRIAEHCDSFGINPADAVKLFLISKPVRYGRVVRAERASSVKQNASAR